MTGWNIARGLDGLEVALSANNVGDEFYCGSGPLNALLIGGASLVRGKPESYGAEFYYKWEWFVYLNHNHPSM